MEETKKKEPVKQIQKNLKFSTEEERNELTTLLTNMQLEGATDGAKILNLMKSLMSSAQYEDVTEGAHESLKSVYEGGIAQLEILTNSIKTQFANLMTTSSKTVEQNQITDRKYYEKKISNLEKLVEKTEEEKLQLKTKIENLEEMLTDKRRVAVEALERSEELEKLVEDKDKLIEELRSQITKKDGMIEEIKREKEQALSESKIEKEDLKKSIVDLTNSQQDYLKKVDDLRAENDRIKLSYQQSNEVNNKLTLELKEKELKAQFIEQEVVRIRGEVDRITETNKVEVGRLQKELETERQSKSDLLIKFMDKLSTAPTPTVEVEDNGKDSQSRVTPKPKSSVNAKKIKTTYKLLNEKGKEIFSGNWDEFVTKANGVQKETTITPETEISEIEKLLSPCTIKVIKK